MNHRWKLTSLALCAMAATSLAACGGGHHGSSGGNEDPAPDPDNPENPASHMMNAQLLLGYVEGATLCADLNRNSKCDGASGDESAEPSAATDAKGMATLKFTDKQKEQADSDGSVRLIAFVPSGSANTVLGKAQENATPRDMLLTATIFSPEFYGSDEDGTGKREHRITPFTNLTDSTMDQTKAPSESGVDSAEYDRRLGEIASVLGLDGSVIASDYNDPANASSEAVRAVAADELIIATGYASGSYDELESRSGRTVSLDTLKDGLRSTTANLEVVMDQMPSGTSDLGAVADVIETSIGTMAYSFADLSSGKGADFRCAATRLGNVYCWGANAWANLGDPDKFTGGDGSYYENGSKIKKLYSHTPVQVRTSDGLPLGNIVKVETGRTFACGISGDGGVYCWGDNYFGQAGQGTLGTDSRYAYAAGQVLKGTQKTEGDYLTDVTSLAMGRDAVCALTSPGAVFCWGNNSSRQLGGDYADHDLYEPFSGLTNSDGTAFSHGFAVKAVPYPVEVTFPGSLKMVQVAAGDWTFCAISDTSAVPKGESNLFCWGNDTTGLIGDIADHLEGAWDAREKYARFSYNKLFFSDSYTETSKGDILTIPNGVYTDFLEKSNTGEWKCYKDYAIDGQPTIKASELSEMYRRYVNRKTTSNYYIDNGRLAGRDWLVHDSDGHHHPLFGATVTRIETALDINLCNGVDCNHSVSQEAYDKYHFDDGEGNVMRKITGVTDIAFGRVDPGHPTRTQSWNSWDNNSSSQYNYPADAYLTVGYFTDENRSAHKRWMVLSQSEKTSENGKVYECVGKRNDGKVKSLEECQEDPRYHHYCAPGGGDCDAGCYVSRKAEMKMYNYARKAEHLYNNATANGTVGSEDGLYEALDCTWVTRNNGNTYPGTCDGDLVRFDGDAFYPAKTDLLKASNSRHSSCQLAMDPEDDSGLRTILQCSGMNLFGQLGREVVDVEYSVNGGDAQTTAYADISLDDYGNAWMYSFKKSINDYDGGILGLSIWRATQDQVDALSDDLVGFLGTWNQDLAWSTLSCGAMTTDDPLFADRENDSSCGGVHGNEGRNSVLEDAMRTKSNTWSQVSIQ